MSPESFVDSSVSYRIGRSTDLVLGVGDLLTAYPDRATSIIPVSGEKYLKTRPYDETAAAFICGSRIG